VLPGSCAGNGDDAIMTFTIAGVVRNVAGNAQARKGDGIDIGCDHLLLAACARCTATRSASAAGSLVSAEMVDDEIFDRPASPRSR
jgi:hypothetical protein